MGPSTVAPRWWLSILYLFLVSSVVHLLRTLVSTNLIVGHRPVSVKKTPLLPLRFRPEGTFKILQLADMHYANGMMTRCKDVFASEFNYCSDLNTTQFVRKLIQAERPDFIAFTGDNIFGPSTSDAAESLFGAFGPAIESKLPWAAILGNHDQESTMTREELMNLISLMDYSVAQINPSDAVNGRRAIDIDGFGNYDLQVLGALGSHLANISVLNLYFLDSGDRSVVEGLRTYGWIKESQLQWLHDISHRFQEPKRDLGCSQGAASSATSLPALAFFHIPIPEIRLLYNQKIVGQFQEAVACSSFNSGVLQTFISMGDVKAVFMGHDHINDFCGNIDSIWFCYGGGLGYHGYGRAGWHRRARIISVELGKERNGWSAVERIKTWKRLDDLKLSKIDEQVLWEQQSSI